MLLVLYNEAWAHPGRTAADGCHYCRTNCTYWGVPWNARHCHGGSPYTSTPSYNPPRSPLPAPVHVEAHFTEAGRLFSVARVIDGDTIEVIYEAGQLKKVRLIGIDTPETVDPRKPVQCFGQEASAKTKALLEGKQVRLEKDTIGDSIDKYGRLLRYVYVDGTLVNAELIKQGYAYASSRSLFQNLRSSNNTRPPHAKARPGFGPHLHVATPPRMMQKQFNLRESLFSHKKMRMT